MIETDEGKKLYNKILDNIEETHKEKIKTMLDDLIFIETQNILSCFYSRNKDTK